MKFYELFILAVGLSMDAFAVAVCKGLAMRRVSLRQAAWVGLWFGGFQFLMPLLGFLLANSFAQAIASFDHWIAFLLLAVIGGNMVREALSAGEEEVSGDLSVRAMFLLAIATSIDALAAGISLVAGVSLPLLVNGRFNPASIWVAIGLIGLTTFLLSTAGVKLGNRFGARYEKKAELAGGLILILLGLKILLEHLGVLA
ncbi:MAG: manganese efflux pump MntP family protein [Oscillospiraceae bacterium]